MNLEKIKRVPLISFLYRIFHVGYGTCGVCGLPWSNCSTHRVQMTEYDGFFSVCEYCWEHASIEQIKQACTKLYYIWESQGTIPYTIDEMHQAIDKLKAQKESSMIDKVKEEPVSEDFEEALAEEWKGYKDRGAAKVDALEDNTQELAFAKGFYRGWHYKKENPISEDLEDAASMYAKEEYNHKSPATLPDRCIGCYAPLMYAFKAGANWQKEQFEKNRLAACDKQTEDEAEREQDFVIGVIENEHRKPTFDDAIKYGMRLQRENMMKEAVDAVVHIEAGNYPYIPQMELYDYDKDVPLAKEGDKYKVVLIKEG